MRKLTLLLLCLALGIGVCDAKKKSRGVYFRTDAEIVLDKPYFGLNVSNMIQVVLEADRNPASVRVETENVPAEAVSVRVRRGELVLACDPGALSSKRKNDTKRVVVYVGTGSLSSFTCFGASTIASNAVVARPQVKIAAAGASVVMFDVECQTFELGVAGASSYQGYVNCQENTVVDVSGASELYADIRCADISLKLGGSSNYKGSVFCRGGAGIELRGVSELYSDIQCRDLHLVLAGSSCLKGDVTCLQDSEINILSVSELHSDIRCRDLKLGLTVLLV